VATVGGNICLSLPAGPMIALAAALDGIATIWADGHPGGSVRHVAVRDFVTGDRSNVLRPGELLRSVFLPTGALSAQAAFRQVSLSPVGRSAVLVIGTRSPAETVITVTAAVPRPVQARFAGLPHADDAASAADAAVLETASYLDDVHGNAAWRRAMTRRSVREVISELAGAEPAPAGQAG